MPADILHILGTAQAEGAAIAHIVGALANGVDPERYRIHTWFLGPPGPLAAELELRGATVRELYWEWGARDPAGAWRFWRELRSCNFAIVHQHYGGRSVRGLAAWATRAPVIIHLHGRILESRGAVPIPLRVGGADAVIA